MVIKLTKHSVPSDGDRFLWVRFRALGDVLQALAEVYLIKQIFPTLHICFLTKPEYAEIVRSQPYIEEVICGDKAPISIMKQTAKLIKANHYNWIGYTYKGMHMPYLAWRSGIKNRLGNSNFLPFLETANIYKWGKANGIDFHSRLEKSCFATQNSTQFAKNILSPFEGRKKIFCIIGASTVEKMWPTAHWIEFLTPIVNDGWSVVLNGYGEREQKVADEIADNLPKENVLNLVGKLNYVNMIGVVSECRIAVGNDTGPLHMAALCGIPTVGIFDYIQPIEVGYNMPWLNFAVAREEKLQTFYAKKRQQSVLAEIEPQAVREKFDELVRNWL